MNSRLVPLLTLLVGLGAGAAAVYWLREPAVEPKIVPHAGVGLELTLEEPEANPEGLPQHPPQGILPPEASSHPEYFEDLEGQPAEEDVPEPMPAEVDFAQLEKLTLESDVPHRTVGAWDEAPESSTPGARRAFVVVVEPTISTAELEALARDLRGQHRDARILNVRIFDSEKGARRAGWVDGGALAHEHLVAQVNINEGLGLDVIRVRGRLVEP